MNFEGSISLLFVQILLVRPTQLKVMLNSEKKIIIQGKDDHKNLIIFRKLWVHNVVFKRT